MAFPVYPYQGYQPWCGQPAPDQLAQLRQNQWPMQTPAQPQIMPQIPAMQPAQAAQNSGIIWVDNKQAADAYLVAPGSAVALWDINNPVVYLRQADNTGKPTTKVYDLVERTDAPPAKQAPQVDMSRYITIDAAEEIIDRRVNDILTERLKRPARAGKPKEDTENG